MSGHSIGRIAILNQVVVFTLGEQRYGLPIFSLERVARIVEITSLPKSPNIILGLINLRGQLTPVVALRRRFRLSDRENALTDEIVVARTSRRPVALVVDAVSGVLAYSEPQVVGAGEILPDVEYIEGVVELDDGLVLIHDLKRLLC